ncbi:MAG: DUF3305 domain-containing protein [Gammaproteobacteria bacterium]
MGNTSGLSVPENCLDPESLPGEASVSVIMRKRPAVATPWVDELWEALAVLVSPEQSGDDPGEPVPLAGDQLRYDGLRLRLFKDQCESYYHNLLSDRPRLFVLARENESGTPVPFHVSASFDEAGAGMEDDELVYDVSVPPQVYRWIESYVLIHYAPQLKYKRKLNNWRDEHDPKPTE